jgi:hypothetical protein
LVTLKLLALELSDEEREFVDQILDDLKYITRQTLAQ